MVNRVHHRSFSTMPLQAYMEPSEWLIFNEEVANVADDYPDIIGVLAIGSLVQSFRPPTNFYENRRPGAMGVAYESIRNPSRRKTFPSNNSDLDIWVAIKDTEKSNNAERAVNTSGIALLEELSTGMVQRGTLKWNRKKESAFREYYKNTELYPQRYITTRQRDGEPWMAGNFKTDLEQAIQHRLPDFKERVSRFTQHKIPGDFLEIRAFPESLFNLRPDDVWISDIVQDRQPFPRIADEQWIGPSHTSTILYSTPEISIYPFVQNGRILGEEIHDHISSHEPNTTRNSYGAILLKPDAIENNQVAIIKKKIIEGIAPFSGRIVLEKLFDGLTHEQVSTVYPSLSGANLSDAIKYLNEGRSLGIVVQANITEEQLLQEINSIKGPRVGDRTEARILEGRKTDSSVRDLLPLPGDEDKYQALLPSLFRRKVDPDYRFSDDEYTYYAKNLIHSPDNRIELKGLLDILGFKEPNC